MNGWNLFCTRFTIFLSGHTAMLTQSKASLERPILQSTLPVPSWRPVRWNKTLHRGTHLWQHREEHKCVRSHCDSRVEWFLLVLVTGIQLNVSLCVSSCVSLFVPLCVTIAWFEIVSSIQVENVVFFVFVENGNNYSSQAEFKIYIEFVLASSHAHGKSSFMFFIGTLCCSPQRVSIAVHFEFVFLPGGSSDRVCYVTLQ